MDSFYPPPEPDIILLFALMVEGYMYYIYRSWCVCSLLHGHWLLLNAKLSFFQGTFGRFCFGSCGHIDHIPSLKLSYVGLRVLFNIHLPKKKQTKKTHHYAVKNSAFVLPLQALLLSVGQIHVSRCAGRHEQPARQHQRLFCPHHNHHHDHCVRL